VSALAEGGALAYVVLGLPSGDKAHIALHGAHVLSWQTAEGQERLYLSPQTLRDGQNPIRGGVPICFPQFNQRVLGNQPLPKHGFARTLPWVLVQQTQTDQEATAVFQLTDSLLTRAVWPAAFEAQYRVRLTSGQLQLEFSVRNTGMVAWPFALALHTYLRVVDIAQTQLLGLAGQRYWDGVLNLHAPDVRHTQTEPAITFSSETDRVYNAATTPLQLQQTSVSAVQIAQSANLLDTVVWNPGAALCATLTDMPADGYQHMLCVEAARINHPVTLQPGETWAGWQRLSSKNGAP
jgi:glucose-6-phosphate 1-epimerase